MRMLFEVDFRRAVIADRLPTMVGDKRTSGANRVGYLKGLLAAVREKRIAADRKPAL